MLIKYLRSLLKSSFRHERKLNLDHFILVGADFSDSNKYIVVSPIDGKLFIKAIKKDVSTKSYQWLILKDFGDYIGSYSQIESDSSRVGTPSLDVTRGQQITLYGFYNLTDVKVIFVPYTNS